MPARWYAGLKLHPVACDCAIALVLLVINLAQPGAAHGQRQIELTFGRVVIIVIACVAVVFRRRAPLVVLAITTAAAVAYAVTTVV